MSVVAIDLEPPGALRRGFRSLKSVWGAPSAKDGPYSPVLCLALLMMVGLLVNLGH